MNKQYINFSIEDVDIIDEEIEDSQFATAKILAFSSGTSRNNTKCSEDALIKNAPTIFNKPILYSINKIVNDFYTHVEENALIAGFIVPNSSEFVRQPDGRLSLKVFAKIWKKYAPKAIQIFQRDGGNKKISVEVEIFDSNTGQDGLLDMIDFSYAGVCLLGDDVTEASMGANMQIVSFAQSNAEYKKAYEKEFAHKYSDVDMSIPQNVKSNAKKGLELYKQHGKGGTPVNLAHARHLVNSTSTNADKLRNMSKYFTRHKSDDLNVKEPPSTEYISYMLYGGNTGRKWSQDIVTKLDEKDNNNVSYFGETTNDENKPEKEVISMDDETKEFDEGVTMATPAPDDKKKEADEEKKEDPKEEKTETPSQEDKEEKAEKDDKKEKDEKNMSLDANLDVAAMLQMLQDETDDYEEIAAGFSAEDGSINYAAICQAMYAKMQKMSADMTMCNGQMAKMAEENTAYMAENDELKKFKADIESKQFEYEVNYTLKEVEMDVPKEEFAELREQAKNFTLANIDGWKNAVKAKAFSFAKSKPKENGQTIIGLPFNTTRTNENKTGSRW